VNNTEQCIPFAPPALPGFFAHMGRSFPSSCSGTLALADLLLELLSLALRCLRTLFRACFVRYSVDSNVRATGFHVPYKSLCQARAASTPGTIQAVNRFPLDLSRVNDTPSVLMPSIRFRRFFSGSFSFTFLTSPDAIVRAFSATLTTLAFDQRSLRWFETSSCKAVSEDLPPSLVQHRIRCDVFLLTFRTSCVHVAPSSAYLANGMCGNLTAIHLSRAWCR
jgi:hypothetical protein